MVARRSTRARRPLTPTPSPGKPFRKARSKPSSKSSSKSSSSPYSAILSRLNRDKNNNVAKRKSDNASVVPAAKRRKVDPSTFSQDSRTSRGTRVPVKYATGDVVNAVMSDSPISKLRNEGSDEELDVQELEHAKKNLFKVDIAIKTPTKDQTTNSEENVPEAPKSAGKFFKNRTPQKSKVQAARAKSISLIRQTCLGQKIKKDKGRGHQKFKITSKPAPKFKPLKFRNDCVEGSERNISSSSFEEDAGGRSDENPMDGDSVDTSPSEVGSQISGPVMPSPIFAANVTHKLHLPKPIPKVKVGIVDMSSVDVEAAADGAKHDSETSLSSTSSFSTWSLKEVPEDIPSSSCQILAGSVRTRSAGSSPALSTRQKCLVAPNQEKESGPSPACRTSTRARRSQPGRIEETSVERTPSQRSRRSTQEKSPKKAVEMQNSQDSDIIPSSQPIPNRNSQDKIHELLQDFMFDGDCHLSPKKTAKSFDESRLKTMPLKSPAKTRVSQLVEQEVRRSPRKSPNVSPQKTYNAMTGLKSDEVILYSGNSPKQEHTWSPGLKKTKLIADKRAEGLEQTALDFGQKDLGTRQCPTCRMVYNQKDPEDEKSHVNFHQGLLTALKFPGWKSERIAQQFADGARIIIVLPDDKQVQKKVCRIQQVVDKDLGFMEADERPKYRKQTYLYISGAKRVEGYCVAEGITSAFPVLSSSEKSQQEGRQKAWCCSSEPVVAKCGISRVWVFSESRRQGIASKLLDCVRFRFYMGSCLQKMELAFTDPTPLGRAFATAYVNTQNFLVYK